MPPSAPPRGSRGLRTPGVTALLSGLLATTLGASAATAQKVRITNLSDIDFGTITNLQSDSRRSQNVCLYSSGTAGGYSVLASGSGSGAAFALSNGPNSLSYAVEWTDRSGQSSGANLSPNMALTGQASTATHQFCNSGPQTTASLTVVFRAADLSQAREGNYTGALTLLIAAE